MKKKKVVKTTLAHWGIKTEAQRKKVERWLAGRKEAGRKIDPETAEIVCVFAQTLDPYGVYPKIPEGYWQVGRECFVRSPGSKGWVLWDDLPAATRRALTKKQESKKGGSKKEQKYYEIP